MPSLPRSLRLSVWWLAAAFVLAAVLAAAGIELINGDGLDHLNSARWLWKGDRWTRFIDHRPPTLTFLLIPLALLYESFGLAPDTALRCCRFISALALAGAAVGAARALPRSAGSLRPLAALLVASSPLLLALAPTFSQDVCAAGGVALVLWLQRRLHDRPGSARLIALGMFAGVACLLRFDTGLIVLGVVVGELWARTPKRRVLGFLLVAGGVAVSLFALQYVLRFGGDVVPGVRMTFLDATDAVRAAPAGRSGAFQLYPATWLRTAGPLVLAAAAWGARRALTRRDPVGVAALACLAFGAIEFGLLVRNAHPRYMGQLIPPCVVLASFGVEAACERLRTQRGRSAVVVAVAAWPALLGLAELWAFRDPAYLEPSERHMAADLRQLAGFERRVWQIGGAYVIRPERRAAFVRGDVSTRTHVIGVGGLSFRLRQPIYNAPIEPTLWQTLLPLGDGDAALLVLPVDFRAWPLRRSEGARVILVLRDELLREGDRLVGRSGLAGRIEGDRLVVSSSRELTGRTLVLVGGEGSPRSLGVHRIGVGETRVPWDGGPFERLVLIGGETGPFVHF